MNKKNCLLTIDVDSVTPLIAEVGHNWVQCFDEIEQRLFGIRQGVDRLLEIMMRYNIKATFFIPAIVVKAYPNVAEKILKHGHEIGCHGMRHHSPRKITMQDFINDISQSLEIFQKVLNLKVSGYRAPYWELNREHLTEIKRFGFSFDSSLMGFEEAHFIDGLIEIPVSWELDDAPYWQCSNRSYKQPNDPQKTIESWKHHISSLHRYGGIPVITIHPWICGRSGYISSLEDLCIWLKENDYTLKTVSNYVSNLEYESMMGFDTKDINRWS